MRQARYIQSAGSAIAVITAALTTDLARPQFRGFFVLTGPVSLTIEGPDGAQQTVNSLVVGGPAPAPAYDVLFLDLAPYQRITAGIVVADISQVNGEVF